MDLLETIILGIVEGLTEFLPVSSTGHMILAAWLLKMENTDFLKTFEVVIQLGAILAVVGIYYKRLLSGINIYLKLFTAFLPAGIIGALAHHAIKEYLFNVYVVSTSLIVGGIILIIVDWYMDKRGIGLQAATLENKKYPTIDDISYIDAVKIGFAQCVAMVPGVSRAAATMVGGIGVGFTARQATEFSFLLAIPTMFAATAKDSYETYKLLHPKDPAAAIPTGFTIVDGHAIMGSGDYITFAIGFVIAFLIAFATVKVLIRLVERYGFKYFGLYRIAVGVAFLILALVCNYNMPKP